MTSKRVEPGKYSAACNKSASENLSIIMQDREDAILNQDPKSVAQLIKLVQEAYKAAAALQAIYLIHATERRLRGY